MNQKSDWLKIEFEPTEEELFHSPIDKEFQFYQAVTNGNIEYVKNNIESGAFSDKIGKGTLSPDPLRNMSYHFVVTAAMLARYCIRAGMTMEQAYRLSDYYIQQMDTCSTTDGINLVHSAMLLDFTTRMQKVSTTRVISKAVYNATEYIYANIHNRITVDEIADNVGISPSHLSRTFKKEMGLSISEFIRGKKIETAKNLLRYSDYSYIAISNYLGFDSQSHFIKVFKEREGITPHKYRNQTHKASW